MTINELLPGQKATIIKINRLMAMGITPGTSITILARHPFRGPVTVDLGNNRMAIGQEIARAIEVKPQ